MPSASAFPLIVVPDIILRAVVSLCFSGLVEVWGIHHYRGVLHEKLLVDKFSVECKLLFIKLVVARVPAPNLKPHLVIALDHLVFYRWLVYNSPFADEIVLFDGQAKLKDFACVVADHQIYMGIKAGCSACKGLCAVGIGKDVIAVAVAFNDRKRRVRGHPEDHICKLMNKYIVETFAWNAVNTSQPTTVEQSYINAENFLQTQGAKTITKTVKNYAQRLSKEEIELVKSLEVIRN